MDSTPRTGPARSGCPEILIGALVHLAAFGAIAVGLPLIGSPALQGIVGLVVSGAMGLAAFAGAALIRIRGVEAFGVRRATASQLLTGAGLRVAAYVVGTIFSVGFIMLTGYSENVQSSYQAGAVGAGPHRLGAAQRSSSAPSATSSPSMRARERISVCTARVTLGAQVPSCRRACTSSTPWT